MINPTPMMPYPGAFGMGAQMPTQPVMPTQPMYNPYAQQPMQQSKPDITVAQVSTIDQVEQVQMLPGERKIILVQNVPVMAIRIADQMGLVQTEYRKTETFDPHTQQPAAPAAEYAPLSAVQQLQHQVETLTNELNAMKGGMTRGKSVKQPVQPTE